MAYSITFSPDAWADYLYWQTEDKKALKRINKLLQELPRHAVGMSKRIDDKKRLTYTMEGENLIILSCRGHYED